MRPTRIDRAGGATRDAAAGSPESGGTTATRCEGAPMAAVALHGFVDEAEVKQIRGELSGQGRDRTADLPLFRRSLVPAELPGRTAALARRRTRRSLPDLIGAPDRI